MGMLRDMRIWTVVEEFSHRDITVLRLQELDHKHLVVLVDSDVLGDLVIARVKELGYGLVIKKEVRDGHLEELCDADVVLLEVLGDSGIISGKELSDSDIEEFGDGDIVGLEEARGGSTQELGH